MSDNIESIEQRYAYNLCKKRVKRMHACHACNTRLRSIYGEQCMSCAQFLNGLRDSEMYSEIHIFHTDLAHSNFTCLAKSTCAENSLRYDDVSRVVQTWIKQTPVAFFEKGIMDLVSRCKSALLVKETILCGQQ